jgi:hypothetical protein
MDVADAGLRVFLQLIERHAHTLPMRLSYALVAANKRGCDEVRITGVLVSKS